MTHDQDHGHPHEGAHAADGAHPHKHTDERPLEHAPEWHQARMHQEDLVLDIGGEIGALVIEADASWSESEVEISPVGDDAHRTHTAFHERRIGGTLHYVGVFPELRQGEYRVWVDDPSLANRVAIEGGSVTTLEWTTPVPRLPNTAPGSGEESGA